MWNPFRRAPVTVGTRFTESAASDRDRWARDKDEATRPGVGGTTREMSEGRRRIAVQKSRVEYDKSPVYGGLTDRFLDFVLGDGVVIKAKDKQVDEWLQRQLGRGWYGNERRHFENLFVDGERLLVVMAPDRGSGAPIGEVKIGTMDPLSIQGDGILVSPFDQDEVVALKVRGSDLREFTLPLMREGAKPAQQPVTDAQKKAGERAMWTIGSFLRVNVRGARGVPALLRTLDHASDLDNMVGGLSGQVDYAKRLWLAAWLDMPDDSNLGKDSKFQAAKAALLQWAASWEPGEIAVFSGSKERAGIEAFAPKFEMADTKNLYDMQMEQCLGGHGIPRFWFGSANDASKTSAAEQGTPIYRAIVNLQSQGRAGVENLVRAVLAMGEASGVEGVTVDAELEITMATVATRDSERDVRELSGLLVALDEAVSAKVISAEERQAIGRKVMTSKGWGDMLQDEQAPDLKEPAGTPPDGTKPALPAEGGAPAVPAVEGATAVQDTALNGAQVASLLEIVQGVTDGTTSPEAAILIITLAFPAIDEPKARRMVMAAQKFTPEKPETPPALEGQPTPPPFAKGKKPEPETAGA